MMRRPCRLLLTSMLAVAFLVPGCSPSAIAARDRRLDDIARQTAGLERVAEVASLEVPPLENSQVVAEARALPDPAERSAMLRLLSLQYALSQEVTVSPEPVGDVSDGLYLAHVTTMTGTADRRAITIDVVTDGIVPWATKRDRELSSWPDFYGWNRHPHEQTIPVSQDVVFVAGSTLGDPRVVSASGFAAELASGPDPGYRTNYYVHLRGGAAEVSEVWEWRY